MRCAIVASQRTPQRWLRRRVDIHPKRTIPDALRIAAFLDALAKHNPELVELAQTIIGTGLRLSLGLRFQDADFEFDGNWALREGTNSIVGRRTISVAPAVIEALRKQQARVAEWRLRLGKYWTDVALARQRSRLGSACLLIAFCKWKP